MDIVNERIQIKLPQNMVDEFMYKINDSGIGISNFNAIQTKDNGQYICSFSVNPNNEDVAQKLFSSYRPLKITTLQFSQNDPSPNSCIQRAASCGFNRVANNNFMNVSFSAGNKNTVYMKSMTTQGNELVIDFDSGYVQYSEPWVAERAGHVNPLTRICPTINNRAAILNGSGLA